MLLRGMMLLMMSGAPLLLCLCGGTAGGTCELYGADNCVLGVHQLEALEVEVAYCERLAQTEDGPR